MHALSTALISSDFRALSIWPYVRNSLNLFLCSFRVLAAYGSIDPSRITECCPRLTGRLNGTSDNVLHMSGCTIR